MIFARSALVFSAALSLALPALAQDDPEASPLVAACDAVAAHPANSDNPAGVTGLGWDDFDAVAAQAPCEAAFAAFPTHDRTAFQLGRAEHKLGNLAAAIAAYQPPADRGYVRAQIGLMVLYGDNPALDGAGKAASFGDACAAQGELVCQVQLGHWFDSGHNDLPQDKARALSYRRLAAAQGDVESQYLVGLALERGNGAAPDLAEALTFYAQAAAQGDIPAQFRLGRIHMYGPGVAPDYDAAFKWMSLVAEGGKADDIYRSLAQYDLAMLYFEGNGVAQDQARALALLEASAAQGISDAQSYAGWMYDEGVGVAEDDARAVAYYLPAAGAGDFFAQNNLAVHYDEGLGVAQSDELALYWYEKAAAQGDAEDQYIVGGRYLSGLGTEKDFYKAAEWFRRAADQGHAKAAAELDQMIADGLVVPGPAE